MKKLLSICACAALVAPLLAATQAERNLVDAQIAAGLLIPSQTMEMNGADRDFCLSGVTVPGTTIEITFTLAEDCCNWAIDSCPSVGLDSYFTSLVGPGISLGGWDDPGACANPCGNFQPDYLSAASGSNNNGGPMPDCLPAGTYVLSMYTYSYSDAACTYQSEAPFTVCINCNGGGGTVGADEQPSSFALAQNFPNPFNPTTSISFTLPEAGEASLKVFDMQGAEVATLVNGMTERGEHTVTFDAGKFSTGVYVYTLKANGMSATKKMVLVK